MNTISDLLGIVFTEAAEYGGIQEVPDSQHGAEEHYHSEKRDARRACQTARNTSLPHQDPIQYDLELVEMPDGSFSWEE